MSRIEIISARAIHSTHDDCVVPRGVKVPNGFVVQAVDHDENVYTHRMLGMTEYVARALAGRVNRAGTIDPQQWHHEGVAA